MVVRIRISRGPRVQDVFAGAAGLLTLGAVACFIMSAWKLMADLGVAGKFVVTAGVFSHWQAWLGTGIAVQLVSFRIARRVGPTRPLIS